jgi:fucose permease
MDSTNKTKSAVIFLLYLLLFTTGFTYSVTGSVLPDISEFFNLTRTQVSSLPLFLFTGSFAGLMLLGFLLSRHRFLLYASALILTATPLGIIFISRFSIGLNAAFFFFGLSFNILVALPGMMLSRSGNGSTAGNMNTLYSFFSAGVMIAPIASGALFEYGFHYKATFLIVAALGGMCCITLLFVKLPRYDLGNRVSFLAVSSIYTSYGSIMVVVLLMNMCYGGAESILTTWMPKYFSDTFPAYSEFRLRATLSLFWLSITVGRQICALILKRGFKPQFLLALMSAAAVVFLVIAPLLNRGIFVEIMFISTGLFFSGMFPTIVSFAAHFSDRFSSIMFILIMAMGTLGASFMSRPVGVIADIIGFNFGIMISVLPLAGIFFLSFITARLRYRDAR